MLSTRAGQLVGTSSRLQDKERKKPSCVGIVWVGDVQVLSTRAGQPVR